MQNSKEFVKVFRDFGVDMDNFHTTHSPENEAIVTGTLEFPGDLKVEVKLNYQSISYGDLMDLYKDDETPEVRSFRNMFDAQPLKYETMVAAEALIKKGDEAAPDEDDEPVQAEEE
ncbi:MAG: hypothetical protein P8Y73_11740, partial [Desulfuromonadales bacterium]